MDTAELTITSPRIQFNWGYHAARQDKSHNWGDRRDYNHERPLWKQSKEYRGGYAYGWDSEESASLSEDAWIDYQVWEGPVC